MIFLKNDTKKQEIKTNNPKTTIIDSSDKNVAECVVLKPVGYPFDFNLMEEDLEITNKVLFEEYAREQWLGLVVKEKSFLFDQKIIPDYGFEIVSAKPDGSIISESTKIKIITEEVDKTKEDLKYKSNIRFSDVVGQKDAKNKVKVVMRY